MKQLYSKALALLLLLALLCSLLPTAVAQTGQVSPNSAKRHVLCTSLSKQADAYYTGDDTYEVLSTLAGAKDVTDSYAATRNNPLYTALSSLMTDTHTNNKVVYSGYSSNALATYWKKTDTENSGSTYLYFYTDIAADDPSVSGVTMNREHIWPKSRASFYQTGGGADLHHLRPSISSVNMAKSNYAFANLVGTDTPYKPCQVNGKDIIWTGSKDGVGGVLEVRDEIKGDVARIMLYVYVRWQQPNLYSNVTQEHLPPMDKDDDQSNGQQVFESLDTLLAWMELDPVDEWEMARNDQVENVQGNRNVFIDYPELAFLLFGKEIPSDMTTPSGKAQPVNYTVAALSENNAYGTVSLTDTTVTATPADGYIVSGYTLNPKDAATVTRNGNVFTLSDVKADCTITILFAPTSLPDPVCTHKNTEKEHKDATCTEAGYDKTVCKDCGAVISNTELPVTDHDFKDGACVMCGKKGNCYDDFTDMTEDDWYCKHVTYALNKGLMNGIGEGLFDPNGSLTRAMLVTILYRYEGEPTVDEDDNWFDDVPSGEWYTKAVVWAATEGIVKGTGRYTFEPDTEITREQIAAILYRYSDEPDGNGDLDEFPDALDVSDYAVSAMEWAIGEGIIGGSDGYLLPQDSATRAECAKMLYVFLTK